MAEELAVIGPGAVGAWLAWRLSAAAPVALIGRRRAWLRAARRGVRVAAARGPARRAPGPIRCALEPSGRPAAVFICVKSADTPAAVAAARRLAGPRTPVVSLQNGLAHVAITRRALGARRAVFAACYAAVRREGQARVRHHAGRLVMVGRAARNGAAAAAARRWLEAAGLEAPSAREDRVLWTKAVFNAATNPVGALAARPNGALAAEPALREIVLAALREAAAAARAAGHPPLWRRMEARLLPACRAARRQENSMLVDLRAGRRTEADAILGPLLAAARRAGRPAPILAALHRWVRRLEGAL